MDLVGVYYYKYYGSTYNICYKAIINKDIKKTEIILCNDNNTSFEISDFNPNNAFWGYLKKDNDLIPVVPMKYYDFQFLMGISGVIFGALLFYAFVNIFTRIKT